MQGQSCSKLSEAFSVLGKEKVIQLLSADNKGIRTIQKKDDIRRFWDHEYDVAYYAFNLAQNYNKRNSDLPLDTETVYVGALLHDIECLLLEVATDEQKEAVKKISDTMENGDKVYNLFLKDFGHSIGCYMLAQKWGLPQTVAQVIHYHNNPDNAPEEVLQLVYIVYLADILQYYKQKKVEFYQINKNVRKWFNIENKKQLDSIVSKMEKGLSKIKN